MVKNSVDSTHVGMGYMNVSNVLRKSTLVYVFLAEFFLSKGTSKAYIIDSFNNWKHAMSSEKGFAKHARRQSHLKVMASWSEFKERIDSNKKIELMVVERIPEHEVWLEVVFLSTRCG